MSGMDDELQYDVMVENALRGVVRQALRQVARTGLPGEHHFYITFRSDHPEVVMGDALRAEYPREMTIVLQYEFWDLEVTEDVFSVTLSFNNRNEHLVVPFDAVIAFADPSVRFGLQFDAGNEGDQEDSSSGGKASTTAEGAAAPEKPADSGAEEESGDNVVTLDRFRKT